MLNKNDFRLTKDARYASKRFSKAVIVNLIS